MRWVGMTIQVPDQPGLRQFIRDGRQRVAVAFDHPHQNGAKGEAGDQAREFRLAIRTAAGLLLEDKRFDHGRTSKTRQPLHP